LALHHFHQAGHASAGHEPRIEQEKFHGVVVLWNGRWRNSLYNCFEYFFDAKACFSRNLDHFLKVKVELALQLLHRGTHIGSLGVHLVYYRDYLQVGIESLVEIAYCLRLNALGAVYDQDSAFARSD
jgi:hypothetical protein